MRSELFQVLGLDHIGIVPSEDNGLFRLLSQLLKFSLTDKENILDQKTVVQKFFVEDSPKGVALEILEPLNEEGVIQRYKDKKKSGIHHIAIRVKGLSELIDFLLSHEVEMIDRKPRIGHNGCRVAFIHPRSTSGVLFELVERDL